MCCIGNNTPTCLLGHEEDIVGRVFVLILLESVTFFYELIILVIETVGDIFQENQAKNDRLIFRRINIATEQVGSFPYLFLKTYFSSILLSHNYLISILLINLPASIPNIAAIFAVISSDG